jgi:hypothetical protein
MQPHMLSLLLRLLSRTCRVESQRHDCVSVACQLCGGHAAASRFCCFVAYLQLTTEAWIGVLPMHSFVLDTMMVLETMMDTGTQCTVRQ